MVPDHQVRRKWSGDASKKVQLFKVGGSRIIGTAVKAKNGIICAILLCTNLSKIVGHNVKDTSQSNSLDLLRRISVRRVMILL